MKTTVEIPDSLYKQSKAVAALRGETLREFLNAALSAHLRKHSSKNGEPAGWRAVFGKADAADVAAVDRRIEEDLERIDLRDWS